VSKHDNDCEHAPASKQITPAQFRELRGKFFTVRHERVKTCGHHLDKINEPTFRNCETCWFSFFASHGELVKVTDEALQEHGAGFVDKLRGKHYRVQFCRFMSTMNRLREESEALQEKNGQGTKGKESIHGCVEESESSQNSSHPTEILSKKNGPSVGGEQAMESTESPSGTSVSGKVEEVPQG